MMPAKIEISVKLLYELYIEKDMSAKEISEMLGCTRPTINNKLKAAGISKNPDYKKRASKTVKTQIERYGKLGFNLSSQKQTMIERYGVDNPGKSKELTQKRESSRLKNSGNSVANRRPDLIAFWDKNNLKSPEDIAYTSTAYRAALMCPVCHYKWVESLKTAGTRRNTCPKCYKREKISSKPSYFESVVKEVLEDLLPSEVMLINNRSVLLYGDGKRYELDFYFPDLKLAIEVNGSYWHDKAAWIKDVAEGTLHSREMHKSLLASNEGIKLLHLWYDDVYIRGRLIRDRVKSKIETFLVESLYEPYS